jgi:hypothetical protein
MSIKRQVVLAVARQEGGASRQHHIQEHSFAFDGGG